MLGSSGSFEDTWGVVDTVLVQEHVSNHTAKRDNDPFIGKSFRNFFRKMNNFIADGVKKKVVHYLISKVTN